MKRNMICIICPKGCSLEAEVGDAEIKISGNACPRGEKYALDEINNPTRTVTAVMRVADRENTMVSVKTAAPVPKSKIFEIMGMIRSTTVTAPVKIGDVVLDNVYGTQVIITKNID